MSGRGLRCRGMRWDVAEHVRRGAVAGSAAALRRRSATGEAGIWGRWCSYSKTGHGGNHELVALLREKGEEYASNFVFGVLETADTRASESDVLGRESHWKELLLSRVHGYNAN